MLKKLVLIVFTALLLFMFGFLYWVVSPMPAKIIHRPKKSEELTSALRESCLEPGAYTMPVPPTEDSEDAFKDFEAAHKKGPVVQIFIKPAGADAMPPTLLALGYGHFLVSLLLVSVLCHMVASNGAGYFKRAAVVWLFGVAATFWGEFRHPIWFHHPLDYWLLQAAYGLGVWFIAGLCLAAIMAPRSSESTNAS